MMTRRQLTDHKVYQSSFHGISYYVSRTRQRGMSLRVTGSGAVWVFSSVRMPISRIEAFVDSKYAWICRRRDFMSRCTKLREPDEADKKFIRRDLFNKVSNYLLLYPGPMPKRVVIRFASTRWGSCSHQGNISINGYLYYLPEPLFEYVLIHELTHLLHLNHAPAFWKHVECQLPDYRERKKALKYFLLPDIWS